VSSAPIENSQLLNSVRADLVREKENSLHLENKCKILDDSNSFIKS
jgi:hypothetical protein